MLAQVSIQFVLSQTLTSHSLFPYPFAISTPQHLHPPTTLPTATLARKVKNIFLTFCIQLMLLRNLRFRNTSTTMAQLEFNTLLSGILSLLSPVHWGQSYKDFYTLGQIYKPFLQHKTNVLMQHIFDHKFRSLSPQHIYRITCFCNCVETAILHRPKV